MYYFYVYKITNIINDKFYIGAHKTKKIDDHYMGSGIAIKAAIKKYGKHNFKKEIISFCENEQDMYLKEKKILEELWFDEKKYNMNKGGFGGWYCVNSAGINIGDNNVMRRDIKAKNKCLEAAKQTREKNKKHYDDISRKNLLKAVEANTGKKRNAKFKKTISNSSKKMWSENKEKIRDALSTTFEVCSPTGEIFITNRLREFCANKNLTYVSLWNTSRTNMCVKKGRSKGWICKIYKI